MSDLALIHDQPDEPTGFVPRPHEIAERDEAITGIRKMERERKLRRLVTVGGGWIFGACMTVVAGAAVAIAVHRPVPRDHFSTGFIRADGVYERPLLNEDLPKDRSDILLKYSLIQYVTCWEAYSWQAAPRCYAIVSAMSEPPLRDRFQTARNDKKNPENPVAIYGDGPGSAKADVIAVRVNLDDRAPNAPTVSFVLRITTPGRPDRTIRKTATIAWSPPPAGGWATDQDPIPYDIQENYDPMGITIGHYVSTDDLGAVQ